MGYLRQFIKVLITAFFKSTEFVFIFNWQVINTHAANNPLWRKVTPSPHILSGWNV